MSDDNDALIKLQTLQKEYQVTLQKYQESVKNYVSIVQSTDSAQSFETIPDSTWWGNASANDTYVYYDIETDKDCQALCSTIENCSGATFNSTVRQCFPRKGSGVVTASDNEGDYAIVQSQQTALATMQYLNKLLLSLDDQIQAQLTYMQPYIYTDIQDKDIKYTEMINEHKKLMIQKKIVDQKLQDNYSLEEKDNVSNLRVVQSSMIYYFFFFLCILVLFITIRAMFDLEEAIPVSLVIKLLIFIILLMNMHSPIGLFLLLIYFIILFLTRKKR